VFQTQDGDVSLSCPRVKRDDDVLPQTLLEHLLLVPTGLDGRRWVQFPIALRRNFVV
jgi:hypothetical protein